MKKFTGIYLTLALCLIALLAAACGQPAAPAAKTETKTEAKTEAKTAPKVEAKAEAKPAAPVAKKEPITLKSVTMLPKAQTLNETLWEFQKRVEQRSNGEIAFRYVGGPEAFSSTEFFPALTKGAFDVGENSFSQLQTSLEGQFMPFSQLAPWEERQSGYVDFLNQKLASSNVMWLGKANWPMKQQIYSRVKIATFADFKGKKFHASPAWHPFLEQLGAIPVVVTVADIYGSLERGIIDGVITGRGQAMTNNWHEVQKFGVEPHFANPNLGLIIYKPTFDKLPKSLQDLMVAVAAELERDMIPFFEKAVTADEAKAKAAGVQFVPLTGDEAKKYEAAFEAGAKGWWDKNMKGADTKLWDLSRKK